MSRYGLFQRVIRVLSKYKLLNEYKLSIMKIALFGYLRELHGIAVNLHYSQIKGITRGLWKIDYGLLCLFSAQNELAI